MVHLYAKLLSVFLAGVSTSLGAAAIALLFEKPKARKRLAMPLGVLAVLLMIISVVIGFDIRVAVPNLDYLTLEDATDRLLGSHLTLEPVPVEVDKDRFGRVIPNSQSLPAGQIIPWGATVSFGIGDSGVIRFEHPRTNNSIDCKSTSAGYCTFPVEGIGSKLLVDRRLDLVLWVKSRGSNWYPQNPNPIEVDQNGNWKGEAQVGNTQNPPSEDELVDLALTVSPHGIGTVQSRQDGFLQPRGSTVDRAERVTIRILRE